jgi:hypothetical protein
MGLAGGVGHHDVDGSVDGEQLNQTLNIT